MFSLFPDILFLTPVAVAFLRIVTGLYFAYIAYRLYVTRNKIAGLKVPVVGHMRLWMVLFSSLATLATGVLLIVGAWTQGAAIVALAIVLKHLAGARRYAQILPLSSGTYALLAALSFALIFTGAGLFGIDWPL